MGVARKDEFGYDVEEDSEDEEEEEKLTLDALTKKEMSDIKKRDDKIKRVLKFVLTAENEKQDKGFNMLKDRKTILEMFGSVDIDGTTDGDKSKEGQGMVKGMVNFRNKSERSDKIIGDGKNGGELDQNEQYKIFYMMLLDFGQTRRLVPDTEFDRIEFFHVLTSSIEFVRDNVVHKLYFRAPTDYTIPISIKQEVLADMDVSTPQDKVRDFLVRFELIRKRLHIQRRLRSHWFTLPIVSGSAGYWQAASLTLTAILNLLMLFFFEADGDSYTPETPFWYQNAVYGFGGAHLAVSFGVAAEYFLNNWYGIYDTWFELAPLIPQASYYVLFVGFSAAGIAFNGYFFAFHLLHIIPNNGLLERAVAAITFNRKGLLLVSLLGLILAYIFTLILFLFYRSDFETESSQYCSTLLECFMTVAVVAIPVGTRESVEPAGDGEHYSGHEVGRWWVDILFWIAVNVIAMNLILGIIVDTFSQLRNARDNRAMIEKSQCFICSRPVYDFVHHGGFKKHCVEDHNMWNYIYYTMYLENLQVAQRNHHELYLYDNWIEHKLTAPFPVGRAGVLENVLLRGGGSTIDMVKSEISKIRSQSQNTQNMVGRLRLMVENTLPTTSKGPKKKARSVAGTTISRADE